MKVDEVRINAQTTVGISIDSTVARLWVIEAIKDICNHHAEAGARTSESVTVSTEGTEYTILHTLLKLVSVEDTEDSSVLSGNTARYVLNDDNTITFKKTGAYEINYLSMPTMPSTTSEEIPLPQLFVPCIEYYLAYKIRGRLYGENDATTTAYYERYVGMRDESDVLRQRAKVKKRVPSRRGW